MSLRAAPDAPLKRSVNIMKNRYKLITGTVLLALWIISITYGRESTNIAIRAGLFVGGIIPILGFLLHRPKKNKNTEPED